MKKSKSDQVDLLTTHVKVLEAENEQLEKHLKAHEDFVWAILGFFHEKNLKAFGVWVANVRQAIDALPNGGKIRETIEGLAVNSEGGEKEETR